MLRVSFCSDIWNCNILAYYPGLRDILPNLYIIMWSCPGNMPKYYPGNMPKYYSTKYHYRNLHEA